MEIEPRNTLNINPNLSSAQTGNLVQLLRKYKEAFAWDYKDVKGIHPSLCTHHIVLKSKPILQNKMIQSLEITFIEKEITLLEIITKNHSTKSSHNQ